jgi:phospholipase C
VTDLTDAQAHLLDQAIAADPGRAGLNDIEHVIILMQENRSFDHYFGTLSGVRGFADPAAPQGIFSQRGYRVGQQDYLQPFRLWSDPPERDGECLNDISHTWPTQHKAWNNGALDGFVTAHVEADGPEDGPVTMGYYSREDLPFYYALADAFTVCDGYFCSVLGPTDANRVMAISGSIDPDGTHGGPVVETYVERVTHYGKLDWETMPERLHDAGVSWKAYSARLGELTLSPLPYFKAFADPFSVRGIELIARGLAPGFPDDFMDDVRHGTLPAVSWIIPPLAQCEHPAAPPEWGEDLLHQVLSALVARPDVWARTVLFVMHDENGGFFDHVPPPTAPAGTPGEWLAGTLPPAAQGIAGPIGLGFRTGCVVISPFSRGGYVCSDVFDHTSTLRFIETRFGVAVPNLSAWRRGVTGDLTSALSLNAPPDVTVPPLPGTSVGADVSTAEQAVLNALTGTVDRGIPYPLPATNQMPAQEVVPIRRRRGAAPG